MKIVCTNDKIWTRRGKVCPPGPLGAQTCREAMGAESTDPDTPRLGSKVYVAGMGKGFYTYLNQGLFMLLF